MRGSDLAKGFSQARPASSPGKRYRDGVSVSAENDRAASQGLDGLDAFVATVDRDAEVPVGLQLGWMLCARIYDGEFEPGQRLPGLRELAEASGLNVNTVRAVYQRLERRGLLESRQGKGTFVAEELPAPSAVGTIAAEAAREAAAIGVSPREVAAALYVAMPGGESRKGTARSSAPAGKETGDGEAGLKGEQDKSTQGAARRRTLRAQIATLERAIGEMEAEHPGVAPKPGATRRGPGPTLLSAAELERVRSALVRRLATVQTAIDEQATQRPEEAVHQKKSVSVSVHARARTHARVPPKREETPKPAPASTATPKHKAKPRSTPRPAPAGT
jgi:GntR family transcriptional regulator